MSILKYLGLETNAGVPPEAAESESFRRVRDALSRLEPAKARYIASFAHILGRVADADQHIHEKEIQAMRRILKEEGGLNDEQAEVVVEVASQRKLLAEAVDSVVTSEFGNMAGREQKRSLMNCLYAVASAEGQIGPEEEEIIRGIADEIHLPNRDLVTVRYRYLRFIRAGSAGGCTA